jgi:hypothetical protein
MAVMSTGRAVTEEAVSASLRVVESALALARAETKLAFVRARLLATHAVALLLGGLIAMTFFALTLVIVTLSPLILAPSAGHGLAGILSSTWPFFLSLSASVAIAGTGAWVALSALRRIRAWENDAGAVWEKDAGGPS